MRGITNSNCFGGMLRTLKTIIYKTEKIDKKLCLFLGKKCVKIANKLH